MKLKLGNAVLNQRALVRIFLIFFLVGVTIGVYIATQEEGKRMPILPFLAVYGVAVPVLIQGIRKNIDSERS